MSTCLRGTMRVRHFLVRMGVERFSFDEVPESGSQVWRLKGWGFGFGVRSLPNDHGSPYSTSLGFGSGVSF